MVIITGRQTGGRKIRVKSVKHSQFNFLKRKRKKIKSYKACCNRCWLGCCWLKEEERILCSFLVIETQAEKQGKN